MPQPQFQDITPPRRSIKDIPLPEKKQQKPYHEPAAVVEKETETETDAEEKKVPFHSRSHPQYESDEPSGHSPKWLVWSIIVIAALIFLFVSSTFFTGASVTVTPTTQNITVNFVATSTKDGANGTLPYDVIILNRQEGISAAAYASTSALVSNSASQAVPVAPKVAAKASGTITIYNAYSSASQDLVATTRFETPSGLIYRIQSPVTVPGETTVGGVTTPGSVQATVYADQTGDKYNVGPTTFTIPGFAGTAKATKFYAKSKTAMTGGVTGTGGTTGSTDSSGANSQVVSANAQLKSALEAEIKSDLIDEAKAQMPDNYVIYTNASLFTFGPASTTADFMASSSDAGIGSDLREQGTGYLLIFDKDELTNYIKQYTQASSTNDITLNGLQNLSVSLDPSVTTDDLNQSNPISVSFNGTVQAVWTVDSTKLANDLKGVSKSSLSTVLKSYPEIASAKASVSPFWKTDFPDSTSQIKVTIAK